MPVIRASRRSERATSAVAFGLSILTATLATHRTLAREVDAPHAALTEQRDKGELRRRAALGPHVEGEVRQLRRVVLRGARRFRLDLGSGEGERGDGLAQREAANGLRERDPRNARAEPLFVAIHGARV